MTFTLSPISVKDKDGATKPMVAFNDGTNNAFANAQLDAAGAVISPATSGKQDTANTALGAIANNTANIPAKGAATSANALPVVIASDQAALPLPTGAATAANQAAGNTALGNLDANLGAKADAAATTDAGTFSLIALLKRGLGSLTAIATSVGGATPAGTNLMGKVGIDQTTPGTTNAVQITGALPAGSNTIGSVNIAANNTAGASTYAALGGTGNALLTNTPVTVKSGAGSLVGVGLVNKGTADAYVQVFDATAATLGTTVPKLSFWVPAGGSWEEKFHGESKVTLATGLTVAATTTATGNTAPGTGIFATIVYK